MNINGLKVAVLVHAAIAAVPRRLTRPEVVLMVAEVVLVLMDMLQISEFRHHHLVYLIQHPVSIFQECFFMFIMKFK